MTIKRIILFCFLTIFFGCSRENIKDVTWDIVLNLEKRKVLQVEPIVFSLQLKNASIPFFIEKKAKGVGIEYRKKGDKVWNNLYDWLKPDWEVTLNDQENYFPSDQVYEWEIDGAIKSWKYDGVSLSEFKGAYDEYWLFEEDNEYEIRGWFELTGESKMYSKIQLVQIKRPQDCDSMLIDSLKTKEYPQFIFRGQYYNGPEYILYGKKLYSDDCFTKSSIALWGNLFMIETLLSVNEEQKTSEDRLLMQNILNELDQIENELHPFFKKKLKVIKEKYGFLKNYFGWED